VWSGDEDEEIVASSHGSPSQQHNNTRSVQEQAEISGLSAGVYNTDSKAMGKAGVLAAEQSRASGSASIPSQNKATSASSVPEPSGGRQIAVRGHWAEFATSNNRTYWMNVLTKEKTWVRPAGITGGNHKELPMSGATLTREMWQQKAPELLTKNHGHIFVGGLNGISEIMFRQHLERFGRLVSMSMIPERGYGFAQFCSAQEAQVAINAMHRSTMYGRRIICKFANLDGIR